MKTMEQWNRGEVCDVANHDCTTRGANDHFGPFVNGIDNIVEASDPLRVDVIKDDLPTLSYELTNASLSGMKDCVVANLKIDKEDLKFQFDLECPHIVMNSDYELKGNIDALYVEGKGVLTVTADDYVYMFIGEYEKIIGDDNKLHAHIKSYDVDVNARGKVAFDMTNLFEGDKVKSDVVLIFFNDNWKAMDKLLRLRSVSGFMALFINNLNLFLKAVPVEEVLTSN